MDNEFYQGYERTFVTARLEADLNPSETLRAMASRAMANADVPEEFQMDDLAFVRFVLASEQENKNGDFFKMSELVRACHTPIHKPFNIEHKIAEADSYITSPLFNKTENTIIGHMVESALARKDGSILTPEEVEALEIDDNPNKPSEECLDLVGSAVLYKFCFPKTVADILETIEDGEMFVSMEAWFKGHDFLVGDEILEYDESTAHYLNDWHSGKTVAGRRVCRVLKSILFGGVAATGNPANEESVFITASKKRLARFEQRHAELHILYKHNPSDDLVREHEEITRLIASLKGDNNE